MGILVDKLHFGRSVEKCINCVFGEAWRYWCINCVLKEAWRA